MRAGVCVRHNTLLIATTLRCRDRISARRKTAHALQTRLREFDRLA